MLVYARQIAGSPARVIALNRSATAQSRSAVLTPDLLLPDGTLLDDALGGAPVQATAGHLPLALSGRSAAVYLPH